MFLSDTDIEAILLTLRLASITTLILFVVGTPIAWWLARTRSRWKGPVGALVALTGLLGPPVAIVLVLGTLYARFGDVAHVRGFLAGVAPAAAGLMIATALKMAEPMLRRGAGPAPVIVVAAIIAIGVLRWPLAWVLLVLVPLSIALAWWWRR